MHEIICHNGIVIKEKSHVPVVDNIYKIDMTDFKKKVSKNMNTFFVDNYGKNKRIVIEDILNDNNEVIHEKILIETSD